ncbi:MAG: coenzyme A pyrophosphatase [Candidatus Aminicenantes bacterium]|nr:MAG: coenzyme A pyrophosphatase [Candidatus Aminicenantes bacterium]
MRATAKDFICQLAKRLAQPKPGLQAQLKMITYPRLGHQVYTEVEDQSQPAAGLILLYPREGGWFLVLTVRSEKVEAHRSQISLPGGRQEQGETLIQTALRETQEELGVNPAEVKIIGQLTPLYIPVSNYCLYPFVGVMAERPKFRASVHEVAEIIEVNLNQLLLPSTKQNEYRKIRGQRVLIPFYRIEAHKIWGATAMVLAEFEEILKQTWPRL